MSTATDLSGYTQWGEDGERSPTGDAGQIYFETAADPVTCNIQKITKVTDMPAYIFDAECGGEGEIWKWRYIAMLAGTGNLTEEFSVRALKPDGKRLFLYDGHNVETFVACGKTP